VNKLRIVHSYPIWIPQTQTWMYNQLRFLPKDKVETYVVCETTENLDQFPTPNLYSLDQTSLFRQLWDHLLRKYKIRNHLGYLTQIIDKKNAHILHSHFGNIGWSNIGAPHSINTKHVVTFYGLDVNMLPQSNAIWYKRYADLFSQADLFLCEGPYMARSINKLGCPKHKIKVHHLGIEIGNIKFSPRRWSSNETLRILIAGSFREKKGITYALKALEEIRKTLSIEITIIGDANNSKSDQLEKQRILETIDEMKLPNHIKLMGYQPYEVLFKEAYKHHIFLSPSVTAKDGDTEGGAPVSIIEMMATGMIVISTKHCDIPNLISNGNTGLLAEERDVTGLVSKINWAIANPDKWLNIQENARKHVENNFDALAQGEKLAQLYQDLCNENLN
jgi:colanic acid/amylovoran biosynthesis glycosyltransferase